MRFATFFLILAVVFLVTFLHLSWGRNVSAQIKNTLSPHIPIAWEHGWKTNRVTATRYQSDVMGFNIGFLFPKNPYDSDRAEIFDFIESRGGSVFQGGGYAGAEIYAKFEGVNDVATADMKLKSILTDLDKLMDDITVGRKIPPFKTEEQPLTMAQWIQKMNAKREPATMDGWLGSGSNGYGTWVVRGINGVKVYEDTTAETQKEEAKLQARKNELINALTTRILTDQEMKEVAALRSWLLIRPMEPYNEQEVESKFQTMLLIQQNLRLAVRK